MSDPSYEILNPDGGGRVVLVCEHASNHFPPEYGGLGLKPDDRASHAAWDPGARAMALLLSDALDAPLVAGTISRLVYDCNRPPSAPDAMPERSEVINVPGNKNLTPQARRQRAEAVYYPFENALKHVLDRRGPDAILVTVHSFTPVYHGAPRAVELGLLHDDDSRLVDLMLRNGDGLPHRKVERNQPYGPEDGVTHTLKVHALSRDLPNVMLEIRNDLLDSDDAIAAMAREVLALLEPAADELALNQNRI